jgi:hypothetical protein
MPPPVIELKETAVMAWKTVSGAVAIILISGCSAFEQTPEQVFSREPGERFLGHPRPVVEEAVKDWQFALISEAAYRRSLSRKQQTENEKAIAEEVAKSAPDARASKEICADVDLALGNAGWKRWKNFPPPELEVQFERLNLRAEVWENKGAGKLVMAFGGTVFSNERDWLANFRWFIPIHNDEYTEVVKNLGPAFITELKQHKASSDGSYLNGIALYSTGHSLGGGLAQQFAYALPNDPDVKRVEQVFAFDPSPVTGFYSVNTETRDRNKQGLKIDRIYQRGEILAMLRSFTSIFYPPSTENPTVRGVRYNLFYSFNPVANHSMINLACQLQAIAGKNPGF